MEDHCRVLLPGTVSIGGLTKAELLANLRELDVRFNPAAEALLADPRFTTLGARQVVEIGAYSVAELGFDEGATYGQLIARALTSGLVACPLELGPHLRIQFLNQPDGSDGMPLSRGRAPTGSLTVASSPIDDSDETPKGFYLRRADGVLWLRGYWSRADHILRPGDVLVFARAS